MKRLSSSLTILLATMLLVEMPCFCCLGVRRVFDETVDDTNKDSGDSCCGEAKMSSEETTIKMAGNGSMPCTCCGGEDGQLQTACGEPEQAVQARQPGSPGKAIVDISCASHDRMASASRRLEWPPGKVSPSKPAFILFSSLLI